MPEKTNPKIFMTNPLNKNSPISKLLMTSSASELLSTESATFTNLTTKVSSPKEPINKQHDIEHTNYISDIKVKSLIQ